MNTFLIVCGAIATIAGAIAAVNQWIIKPIKKIDTKLDKIDRLDKGQKVLIKTLASTLQHIITGNHIEKLKEDYDEIVEFLLNND